MIIDTVRITNTTDNRHIGSVLDVPLVGDTIPLAGVEVECQGVLRTAAGGVVIWSANYVIRAEYINTHEV